MIKYLENRATFSNYQYSPEKKTPKKEKRSEGRRPQKKKE
jgi:hypothetical protein